MRHGSPAYHLAALAMLAAACAPVLAGELTEGDILSGACLTAGQPREEGPIRELTFQITRQNDPAGYSGDLLRLSFTEWDVPNIVFETTAACWTGEQGIGAASIAMAAGPLSPAETARPGRSAPSISPTR